MYVVINGCSDFAEKEISETKMNSDTVTSSDTTCC